MKKLLALFLVLLMLLCLAACGEPEPTAAPTSPTSTPTQPTEPPTAPTEPSMQPTEPPTEPTEPPTQPTELPTEPPHTHSYAETVTAPTCTEGGYTTYTCACGDRYTGSEVAATGHSYAETVTAPTCTEGGYTTYTCACGDTYTGNEAEASGHLDADGNLCCDVCSEYILTDIPTLLQLCQALSVGSTTEEYFCVEGTVASIANLTYGNMYIQDEDGNELYIYGVNDPDGTRYDAMENPPQVGDTVVLYGQMKHYVSPAGNVILEMVYTTLLDLSQFSGLYTLKLDSDFGGDGISKYSTGNYGAESYFEYYRAYQASEDYLADLLPLTTSISLPTLPGSLYNILPIYGIDYIEITYRAAEDCYLYTGDDRVNPMAQYTLPAAATDTYLLIDVDAENFFRLVCGTSSLHIVELTISYTNEAVAYDDSTLSSGTDSYRINPVRYTDTLVDGVSTVTVPTAVDSQGNVTAEKTYTYYSFEYVQAHPELADQAAMTDPVDVINYYQAFGRFPANYVAKQFSDGTTQTDFDTVKAVFGNDTRYVSRYDRTNGYALAVPYSTHNSSSPYYYEFDIALDSSYSAYNRGVGRVVAWADGWSGTGYDHSPVCVYTDDHYATFQEYLNTGCFSVRFDANRWHTNTDWSAPSVIQAAA